VVDFLVICSKGTYIRSLARDFGEELGVGAYLSALRRTKIGNYDVSDALNIEQFEALLNSTGITDD
jgi:tRNA pseudouridine55 synthase